MKLNSSSEVAIAQLTLAVLESKLLDLMKHERFDEVIATSRDAQSAQAAILALVTVAANLARQELGVPPPKTADEPGVQ